ncbi:hypothetical protein GGX14DRAFT_642349 [Mycena pura]|uniref:Uncharacterized protein n=1 Tax=Mycena pura TaxID=153505 RepID=A0AAD7E379_9AGAR|nr:hypothetical protein GGX14DRAFT_642349 [Mycena pura]
MPPSNGIVHTGSADGSSADREYLTLEEMRAKVFIVDVAARVTLTQVYRNPLSTATSRAVYYFPVPASGAVCAFEMRTSDDRVVTAVCKEKTQARQEYERALAEGKASSLLEWVADDVFTVSVGSIPANSTVSTKLVFTMTLPNDDNTDEIRFQLPMCVGERYGPPLTALDGASAPSSSTRIRITLEIQTSGRIQSLTSPSHSNDISETRYQTHLARPSRRRTTVRYRSPTFLDRDFVLVVHAEGLDAPRCFAELQRDPGGRHSDTVAMQLSIVPSFKLPPVTGQEYIFVVDRSGSMGNMGGTRMGGTRIETAKSTLKLLLRMLPGGSTFNIFSFGSRHSGLWPTSKVYDQSSLTESTAHTVSMDADYGGTEIKTALNAVFATRNIAVSTAVFVLTDGEDTDYAGVISDIQSAVRRSHAAGPRCHLRVFCLGIGDGISSAMCEGIARAGNGVCLFAVHTESILGKCAKLFRAGRKNVVQNVTIDWGIPHENLSLRSTVNFSTPSSSPRKVRLRPAPAVQQSPALVADLHAGTRIDVYAILTLRKALVPKEVTVKGELDGGGVFELTVPIRGIQLAESEPGLPLVHTLAAWRLIQDHQEGMQPLALVLGGASESEEEIRKASIVRLGERYQVASRHTSFIAVDNETDTQRRASPSRRARTPSIVAVDTGTDTQRRASPSRRTRTPSIKRSLSPPASGLRAVFHRLFNPPDDSPVETDPVTFPGAWPSTDFDERDSGRPDEGYVSAGSARTFSTLSSLEEHSDSESSIWSDWNPQPVSEEDARMMRSPSPKLEPVQFAPRPIREARRHVVLAPAPALRPPPPTIDPKVIQLAELQLFDGSFDGTIGTIVGQEVLNEAIALNVDVKLWATAVSIAFLSKHLADPSQKELLNELLEKAYEYLGDNMNIIRRAKELV